MPCLAIPRVFLLQLVSRASYYLEEECGLVSLKRRLGVYRCSGAVYVILGSFVRSGREPFDELYGAVLVM